MDVRSRARILVVDADGGVRSLLRRVLTDVGFVVECAPEGVSALVLLRRSDFEAALVGLRLPGMTGAELAAAIGRSWPDTAVVLVSEEHEVAVAARCVHDGVYDYITKPLDLGEVVARLTRVLARREGALGRRRREQQLADGARRNSRATARLLLGAIESLSSALEAKDGYTRGHSERVGRIAGLLARALGEPPGQARKVRLAGKLHDIGKIGVRETVLGKPGSLTAEEWRQVEEHPVVGERILAPLLNQAEIGAMVRGHHERYAGGGYPDGLRGSAIPLGSRVLAVADAFDALTSDRPYRARVSVEGAFEIMWQSAGRQWQPTLVEALRAQMGAVRHIVSADSDRYRADPVEASEGRMRGPSSAQGERPE